MTKPSLLLALLLSLLLAACGGTDAEQAAAEPSAQAAAPAADDSAAAADASPAATDFTEADLDLYERGIAKEIEVVRAAQQRASNATTPQERGAAMQEQWEEQSVPAAAQAAGIDPERYRRAREAVHEVFKTLDFQGTIDGPLSMDMSRVDEETRERLAKDPFDALSPGAAAALRARMDRLVPLWIEYVKMTAVAG
jgi:hypothetical protein